MENKIKSQINIIKANFPKYLDNLPKENVNVLLKSKIKSGSNKRKKRYEDFNDDE